MTLIFKRHNEVANVGFLYQSGVLLGSDFVFLPIRDMTFTKQKHISSRVKPSTFSEGIPVVTRKSDIVCLARVSSLQSSATSYETWSRL